MVTIGFRLHPNENGCESPIQAMNAPQVRTLVARMQVERNRPRIRLSIAHPSVSEWRGGKPLFLLRHLGGEPAHCVQVVPVRSLGKGSLQIDFLQVKTLDAKESEVLLHAELLSQAPGGISESWESFFQADCKGAGCVSYPVHIWFQWASQQCEEVTNLIWDARERTLSVASVA